MKKIIINGRFLTKRVTGVQRYAKELVRAIDQFCQPEEFILAVPPELDRLPALNNIRVEKTGHLHGNLWEQLSFPAFVRRRRGIALNLCNTAPLICPGICTIHDIKVKVHPEYFRRTIRLWYRFLLSREAKKAVRILTVSDFSKEELVRLYGVAPERIFVVPDAWDHIKKVPCDEGALTKYRLKAGAYYFSLSSMDPNKNIRWIAAQARLMPKSVFAVAGGVNPAVFAPALGFEIQENLRLLGYVSDEEAKTLMRDCKAFLFPSFYEGFGMPPLEALGTGAKHVLVSDIPSQREIFGDQNIYIHPDKIGEDIRGKGVIPPEVRERILGTFTWERAAEKLLGILREVIRQDNANTGN